MASAAAPTAVDGNVKDHHDTTHSGENGEELEDEEVLIKLRIKTPAGDELDVNFDENEVLAELKNNLLDAPETCVYTSYVFKLNGKPVNEGAPINTIPELVESKKAPLLEMVEVPYDEKAARFHVRRIRELLALNYVDAQLPTTVLTDLDSDKAEFNGIKEDKALDKELPLYTHFYPKPALSFPKCLAKLAPSGWNPPPPNRRFQGDFFYLDITTLEGESLVVTVSSKGFFLNQSKNIKFDPAPRSQSKVFSTLPGLLSNVSGQFSTSFADLLRKIPDRNPFAAFPTSMAVALPWLAKGRHQDYDQARNEDFAIASTLTEVSGAGGRDRDMHMEYQMAREMPAESANEKLFRDRELYRQHTLFLETATQGAIAILNGGVAALNPLDEKRLQIFTYNDLFFCFAADSREFYKDFGGDATAYKAANNDLHGHRILQDANLKGLSHLPSALIDFRGQRLMAQVMVPGLLQSIQKDENAVIRYGAKNDKTINSDADFHALLSENAAKLHLQAHQVMDPSGSVSTLVSGPELKGVAGTDGRKYLMEPSRLTPRDMNFPEPHHLTCLLRSELIGTYSQKLMRDQVSALIDAKTKAKDAGLTPEAVEAKAKAREAKRKADYPAALAEEQDEYLKMLEALEPEIKTPELLYNVDLHVPTVSLADDAEVLKAEEEKLKALAEYLREECLPAAVADLRDISISIDGTHLTTLLHSYGINMRYLGQVLKLVNKTCPVYSDLVTREMIVRAVKPLWNEIIAPVPEHEVAATVAAFLNAFFGRATNNAKGSRSGLPLVTGTKVSSSILHHDGLWARIRENVANKFQFALPEFIPATMFELPTLRYISIKLGIRLEARNYDLTLERPFEVADIADLQAVVKYHAPASVEATDALLHGKRLLSEMRLDLALLSLQNGLDTAITAYGQLHRDVATAHSQLAMVFYHAQQFEDAYNHQLHATIISERVNGLDHYETAQAYGNLALYAHNCARPKQALNFIKRSLYLSHMCAGWASNEHIHTYMNLANMLQDLHDPHHALPYFLKALSLSELLNGNNHILTSNLCHLLAAAYASLGNYRQALTFEKRHNQVLTAVRTSVLRQLSLPISSSFTPLSTELIL